MGKWNADNDGEYGASRRERRAQEPRRRPERMRVSGKSVFSIQKIVAERGIAAQRALKEAAQREEVTA